MAPLTASLLLFGVRILGDRSIPLIHALGTLALVYAVVLFVGLLICSQLGWGFGFENFPLDVLKCLAVGAVVTLAFWAIETLLIDGINMVPHVRLFMLPIIYLTTKACWREVKWRESLLANGLAVLAAGAAVFFMAGRVAT